MCSLTCIRGTRADDLVQRLSALRLLQMQSNLWNPAETHDLVLSGSLEGHYTTNAALARDGTSDCYVAPSVSISGSHSLTGEWRVSAGTDLGGFRYLRQPDLGTSYADVWGGLTRDFRIGLVEANLYLTVTQQWNQLENFTSSGSLTEALVGLNTEWKIREGQTLTFNPGASLTPLAQPWDAGFDSCGATISYDWTPISNWEISIFYNGYLTAYFSGQTDFTQ